MGGIFAYPCNPPDSNSIIFAPASPDNSKHNSRYQKSSISADENIILKTSDVGNYSRMWSINSGASKFNPGLCRKMYSF